MVAEWWVPVARGGGERKQIGDGMFNFCEYCWCTQNICTFKNFDAERGGDGD